MYLSLLFFVLSLVFRVCLCLFVVFDFCCLGARCVLRVASCLSCVVRWLPLFDVCLRMLFVVNVYCASSVVRCLLLFVGCYVLVVVVRWSFFVSVVCCCLRLFVVCCFVVLLVVMCS